MRKGKIKILCTAALEPGWQELAADQGIILEGLSFIDTQEVTDPLVDQRIGDFSTQRKTVVFTSYHAASFVTGRLGNVQPPWTIYCLEGKTKSLVSAFFGPAQPQGTAVDSAALADRIMADRVREVVFFCGNQRKEDLPSRLASRHIPVHELVVYETRMTPRLVGQQFDGILFFSPSAVKSFFLANKTDQDTVLFAIGESTGDAIREISNNRLIIADTHSKEQVVRRSIGYFLGNPFQDDTADKQQSDERTQE
jgi:uroporphyrinogen-III synthase